LSAGGIAEMANTAQLRRSINARFTWVSAGLQIALSLRLVISSTGSGSAAEFSVNPVPSVTLSTDGTYLVNKANDQPFFMTGDAAWDLAVQLDRSDVLRYLAARHRQGFNTLWVGLTDRVFQKGAPNNFYGYPPFNGAAPFERYNVNYWAYIDWVLRQTANYGMIVIANPNFVGLSDADGWLAQLLAASPSTLTAWGRFLGNRYKSYPNLIWEVGGDADVINIPGLAAQIAYVANGIKSVDANHLMTVEVCRVCPGGPYSSRDGFGDPSWLDLNWVYATQPEIPAVPQTNYMKYTQPPAAGIMGEDWYELEHSMTPALSRQEGYGAILGGAYLGRIFGNNAIWTFNGPMERAGDPSWQSQLYSVGSVQQGVLGQLFEAREHWKLVPDISKTVMTGGNGSGSALAVTARTKDGQTIISYIPTRRVVTINMSAITDPESEAVAWWFNPRTAAVHEVGTYAARGSRRFMPPSSDDWALVIDSKAAGLGAP
jgi:hypothetical protein